MGLGDLNQLIERSIEEVSALFLERGAQSAPVPAQAIGPFSSKGVHHVVVVVGDPAFQRIAVDLEVALQANGVGSDPKHLIPGSEAKVNTLGTLGQFVEVRPMICNVKKVAICVLL